ncbi:LytR C-terminal domain-containing protein [Leucobacter sp. HY1910]
MGQKSAGVGERQSYPEDRFDRVQHTGRVGAHRVTARPRYVWHFVIAGIIGFALLTAVGVFAVHNIGAAGKLPLQDPAPQVEAPKKVVPQLNPEATVAVLNGSETVNLAAALDKIIADEQWGQILFSGAAATQDVTISAVFYSDPADAEAAAGLAAKLGGLSTYTTSEYDEYGAQLIVLLGSDYAGPGIEEAAAMTAAGGAPGDVADGVAVDPEPATDPETPAEQPVE